jgi:DNA-binding response OmpR family regulator
MKTLRQSLLEIFPITSVPDQMPVFRRAHILVVDDDLSIRRVNAGLLLRSGYEVGTAGDGVEAWQSLQDEHYDLLITDHQMPRGTGLELIQKLRSEANPLPVILTSGSTPTEELNRLPGLKIEALMPKPLEVEVFLNTVRELLRAVGLGGAKDPTTSLESTFQFHQS